MANSSRNAILVLGPERWFFPGTIEDEDVLLSSVKSEGDPNCQNEYNVTALCAAVNNFQSLCLVQSLLRLGADPNKETYIGNIAQLRKPTGTALHAAVLNKNAEIVEALLKGGANPNARTSDHKTPLHYIGDSHPPKKKASEVSEKEDELKIFNLLLQNGADVGVCDGEGRTLLHCACYYENLSIFSILLSEKFDLDVNKSSSTGESVLLTAAGSNDLGIKFVSQLLDHGADPNKENSKGWTPLHIAVMKGASDLVKMLLDHAADPNRFDVRGVTPLHEAVREGASALVEMLLDHAADPNRFDVHGVTPLHLAVNSNHGDIIQHLLKNNANPNSVDDKGRTPLHMAVMRRPISKEILKLLVASGVDVSLCDKFGKSAHFYLSSNSKPEAEIILSVLPVLVHQGVDLNIKDIQGKPLLLSCLSGMALYLKDGNSLLKEFENVICRLNEIKVDLNIADWEGKTLLHMAAAGGNSGLVESLLRLGGDRNALDIDRNSPAHIAAEHANYGCVKLLTAGNWSDRHNVRNRTVLRILDDRITQMEDMVRNGWERADFWGTLQAVLAVLQSLRETCNRGLISQTEYTETFIHKLNVDIPRMMNITGLCADIFPVPDNFQVPILVEESPLKEVSMIEELKSERRFADNLIKPKNFQRDSSLIQDDIATVSWRQNLIEISQEVEVFSSASSFSMNQNVLSYVPPAPKAVRNVIRNLSRYVEKHSVGRFHFKDCPCGKEKCEVGRQVKLLVEDLLESISCFEPRYQFKCHLTGSVLEGSKLWAPDEFDFMAEITTMKGVCLSGHIHRPSLQVSSDQSGCWDDLLDSNGNLSCIILRQYLVLLAWKASFTLNRKRYPNLIFNLCHYPRTSRRGFEELRPLIGMSKVGVLLCLEWQGKAFQSLNITVDITPAIPFTEWDILNELRPLPEYCSFVKELGYHVIPAGENWRLSFSFAELELIRRFSNEELSLYKSLKLLRDIHIKSGAPPSYVLKSAVFNYVFKEKKQCLREDLEGHTTEILFMLLRFKADIKRHFFHGARLPELDALFFPMDWCRFSLIQLAAKTDE